MKKTIRLLFLPSLIFILSACEFVYNLHEIDPGKFFRSEQMSGPELEKTINKFGIRTVINLRGESTEKWFQEEAEVVQRLGVVHVNIPMSAGRLPHRQDLIELLEAYRHAPLPILIHCQGGADRSGEAAAIYQMIYMGKSKSEALQMLTPKYFHFEAKKPAKRYFIKEVWQGETWAYNDYDPCSGEYKFYDINDSNCAGN
jgi:protein tyrosine/serine phosphatase